jgi:hypothetical protein
MFKNKNKFIEEDFLQKSLIFNLKSNLGGTFRLWFLKVFLNIGECNSKSKFMDMIYKS